MQIIYLDETDDIVSIRDRLEWANERQVILALPAEGGALTEGLDLVLAQRHADALRLELGLITVDGAIAAKAKALGIPTFRSTEAAQKSRRAWRRGRRRSERLGWSGLRGHIPTLDDGDRREVERRRRSRPAWQRWLWGYAAILLFCLTLAIFFVAMSYALPGATLILRPEVEEIQVSRQIVADPQLDSVNFSGASAPGRRLVVAQEWQAEVETTGTIEIADAPARGRVIFVNQIAQSVTAPAGTRVSTTAGRTVVYQTLAPVEVPGVVGGTAETEVVAIEPGPAGNVAVNQVNRVEGSLGLQLQVRNLEPLEGGSVRQARAVTRADMDRLRAQALQQLQLLALGEMEEQLLPAEFLARDSIQVARIVHETYSHFEGEQTDRLTLAVRAELQATAVDESQAVGLIYEQLAAAVRPGYELIPESLHFYSGEVLGVDGQGRVTFQMIGEGVIAVRLDMEEAIAAVTGQDVGLAAAYLYEHLPLRDYPTIRVWPPWLDQMPYMPARIRVEVATGIEDAD